MNNIDICKEYIQDSIINRKRITGRFFDSLKREIQEELETEIFVADAVIGSRCA